MALVQLATPLTSSTHLQLSNLHPLYKTSQQSQLNHEHATICLTFFLSSGQGPIPYKPIAPSRPHAVPHPRHHVYLKSNQFKRPVGVQTHRPQSTRCASVCISNPATCVLHRCFHHTNHSRCKGRNPEGRTTSQGPIWPWRKAIAC